SLEEKFREAVDAFRGFRLTPRRLNGIEVRLSVEFGGHRFASDPFPASRDLCTQFNLAFGSTIGINVRIVRPDDNGVTSGFNELYATGSRVDTLLALKEKNDGDIYATLLFSEETVKSSSANFFGRTYYEVPTSSMISAMAGMSMLGKEVYNPPEGKIIM